VSVPILRGKDRLMEAGNDQIQRGQHRPGAVNLTGDIFDVGLNTAQDPYPIHQPRPDTHIHKVPVVRGIGHIGAVIGDSEQLEAFAFRYRNIVMEGAVGVGAGDGMHVQVNGVHDALLY